MKLKPLLAMMSFIVGGMNLTVYFSRLYDNIFIYIYIYIYIYIHTHQNLTHTKKKKKIER